MSKLRRLSDNLVVAFAGAVPQAEGFLDELLLEKSASLATSVGEVARGRRTNESRDFRIIFAGCEPSGESYVCSFDSRTMELQYVPELLAGLTLDEAKRALADPECCDEDLVARLSQIVIPEPDSSIPVHGSASKATIDLLRSVVCHIATGEGDAPDRVLAGVIGFAQAIAVNEATMENERWGGSVGGARLDASGLHWMRPTTYYLFESIDDFVPARGPGKRGLEAPSCSTGSRSHFGPCKGRRYCY